MKSANKKTKKNKSKAIVRKKKDNLEIHGKLLYRKSDDDAIDSDDIYQKPNVPGEYAGDC